jgi:hypothetical protein
LIRPLSSETPYRFHPTVRTHEVLFVYAFSELIIAISGTLSADATPSEKIDRLEQKNAFLLSQLNKLQQEHEGTEETEFFNKCSLYYLCSHTKGT